MEPMKSSNNREKNVELIEYTPNEPAMSLKQQLVTAVARGDELAAEELRLLLKLNVPEKLGGDRGK